MLGLAHNPKCEEVFPDNNLSISRAFENECIVVFVNVGGSAKDGFIGRSGVTVPLLGKVGGTVSTSVGTPYVTADLLCLQTTNEEEMVLVDVDLSILEVR